MEDNNKVTSEFENLAKEEVVETPVENNEVEKQETTEQNEVKVDEVKVEEPKVISNEDVQIVDDSASVELPQTKDDTKSSIPESVDISNSNSDSQILGTIKPDKQKSPIAMLVLFGLLIVFILFMPTVISLVNKYFGTDLNIDSLNNPTKVNTPVNDDDQKQTIKMYPLKEDTVIQIDKIDFGGFKKDTSGTSVSFYIKNNGSQLYKFEKKLYLEFYDDNNTFVGRSYLESVKEVTGGITNNYSATINSEVNTKATKVELIQRTNDDYPAVNLQGKQLTCTNDTNNIVYTFDESLKLTGIKDMFTYTKDDDALKYSNDLIRYKTNISKLDNLEGVTAVLTETDTGFVTNTVIDYQNADYSKLSSNTNYYIKDTYAKIVSFEMNAKGYTCR